MITKSSSFYIQTNKQTEKHSTFKLINKQEQKTEYVMRRRLID